MSSLQGPSTSSAAAGGGGGERRPAKRRRTEALRGVVLYAPKSGLPGDGAVVTAWKNSLPRLGATVTEVRCTRHWLCTCRRRSMPPCVLLHSAGCLPLLVPPQDPARPGITHVVAPFPGRGWDAVPPRLQPGGGGGGGGGSRGGPPPGLRYVLPAWVSENLKSRAPPLPESGFAPPPQGSPEAARLREEYLAPLRAALAPPPAGPADDGGGAEAAARRRWLGPRWTPECEQMGVVELALQVGRLCGQSWRGV